jgi:hypothetical protein
VSRWSARPLRPASKTRPACRSLLIPLIPIVFVTVYLTEGSGHKDLRAFPNLNFSGFSV